MSFNYNESVVFWSYHIDSPSDYNPSNNKLSDWDQSLFDAYEDDLIEKMTDEEIPINRENKSRVLLAALVSNGGTVSLKVRNACKYYKNVWMRDIV